MLRKVCNALLESIIKPGEKVDLQAPPAAEKYMRHGHNSNLFSIHVHSLKLTLEI